VPLALGAALSLARRRVARAWASAPTRLDLDHPHAKARSARPRSEECFSGSFDPRSKILHRKRIPTPFNCGKDEKVQAGSIAGRPIELSFKFSRYFDASALESYLQLIDSRLWTMQPSDALVRLHVSALSQELASAARVYLAHVMDEHKPASIMVVGLVNDPTQRRCESARYVTVDLVAGEPKGMPGQ